MDTNIFRYTWRHSRRDQMWLLVVVVVSLPFYFLSLDLPKSIVNGPIQGEGFSSPTDTETAMRIALDLPELAVRRRRDRAFQRHRARPHRDAHLSLLPVPLLRSRERLLQALHLDLQGPARRAHAAPHALPAHRHAAALPAAAVPAAALLRDRHHGEGRGGAARRLHRRRLRPARLSCSARRSPRWCSS